jgi:hypothetical protein
VSTELRLNSARTLKFLAPINLEFSANSDTDQYVIRKRSYSNQAQDNENWEGIREFVQAIDDLIVIDKDTELFIGKSCLELGFTTGLPSLLAFGSGANDVTLHSWSSTGPSENVKLTISKRIPKNLFKFSNGNLETCLRSLGGKKFDIILAPELIDADEQDFDTIIDILDAALSPHGLVLLSGRTFYAQSTGSIQGFLDQIKQRGIFDAFIRWESPNVADVAPRKVIQMTRR